MKNLTPEMIEKAKAAKSAEELLALAKANGVEMTADEAATYFAQLNPKSGELDDDDLDNVAGGAGGCAYKDEVGNMTKVRVINGNKCPRCGSTNGMYIYTEIGPYITCTDCSNGWNDRRITDLYPQLGVDFELI